MSGQRRSQIGLDWLNFFVANVQTGFGPFIAVYLTTKAWTQGEIGEVLSIGTVAAMLSQLPGGAAVDRLRDKRIAAAVSGAAVGGSALLFALAPTRPAIALAEILHSFASSMLGPAIAAISLALVGHAALGERLGRNARFASLGNAAAAALLGAAGTYIAPVSVFWLTAGLMLPAFVAMAAIHPARSLPVPPKQRAGRREVLRLLTDRGVLALALCTALFSLANAALLPLAAAGVTRRGGGIANLLIAAAVMLPQAGVALISPRVGAAADRRGRRAVMAFGFAALPLRALLLAAGWRVPGVVVAVQALDAVSAAVFGVVVPLIAADLTAGTGRFNLCMGVAGLAIAAGASLSTLAAGTLADELGTRVAFLALAAAGCAAVLSTRLLPAGVPACRASGAMRG